jgi:hypothetical protein
VIRGRLALARRHGMAQRANSAALMDHDERRPGNTVLHSPAELPTQISDILAAGDGDDASSQAFAAKELFAFLVSTSEKLAEAESKLLKYGEEEAEREQVRRR